MLDGIIKHLEQLLRFAARVGFGDEDGIPRFNRMFEDGVPLGVGSLHDSLAIGVEDVEGEEPQGQLGRGLLNAVLASPPDGLLERKIFVGERVVRERLALEDCRAGDDLPPRASTISGNEAVISSRLREKILMSSPALCTWHRNRRTSSRPLPARASQ